MSETFTFVDTDEILDGTRVFYSKIENTIESPGVGVCYESRLAAHNYGDRKAATIPTKALSVWRFTQRIALSLAVYFYNMSCHTRDII